MAWIAARIDRGASAADSIVGLEPAITDGREWRDVAHDRFAAGDDDEPADAAKLVIFAAAPQERAFANFAMPAKQCAVGHDHVIANDAIVADVRAGHEEAAFADSGGVLYTRFHRAVN